MRADYIGPRPRARRNCKTSKACQWMQNWPLPGCVVWADLSVRGLDPTRFKLCGRGPGRSGRRGRRGSEAAAGAQSPDHWQAAAAPQQKWPRPARCTKDAWPMPVRRMPVRARQPTRSSRFVASLRSSAAKAGQPTVTAGPGTLLT